MTNPKPIKSILVSNDVPHESYGTGQRLISIKNALNALGECQAVWLHDSSSHELPTGVEYGIAAADLFPKSNWAHRIRILKFRDVRSNRELTNQLISLRERFRYDLAFFHAVRSSAAAPVDVVPCLFDLDALPRPNSLLTRLTNPLSMRLLKKRVQTFSQTFVIRDDDRLFLDSSQYKSIVLPGISTSFTAPVITEPSANQILFIGGQGWPPNKEAAKFLVDKLAPVLARTNRFQLRLVGQGTEVFRGIPGVNAAGFAQDLKNEYANAYLVLCPIWQGSGANIKLAEAVQAGSAVVASDYAAKAFAPMLRPALDVATAANPDQFVEEVLRLLNQNDEVIKLRSNATQRAANELSIAHFNSIVQNAATMAMLNSRQA